MSGVIARPDRDPMEILVEHDGFGLVVLRVADLNSDSCKQAVLHIPTPTEPDHVSVVGPKTDSTRRAMSKVATWVIGP
jgi:hypothetical protein